MTIRLNRTTLLGAMLPTALALTGFATAPAPRTTGAGSPLPAANRIVDSRIVEETGMSVILASLDRSQASRGTRLAETGSWRGGARYRTKPTDRRIPTTCTTGFPWTIDDGTRHGNYLVTAGHCLPDGGWTWAGTSERPFGGPVGEGELENWDTDIGTQPISRHSGRGFSGDLALIPVRAAATSIYVGGQHSTRTKEITGADITRVGDVLCTGGSVSGELCGWEVRSVATNIRAGVARPGQPQPWWRNVAVAEKPGTCTQAGDSGGPVYRHRTSDSVRAHGIINGGGFRQDTNVCTLVFTEIGHAADLWGGRLNVKRFF